MSEQQGVTLGWRQLETLTAPPPPMESMQP